MSKKPDPKKAAKKAVLAPSKAKAKPAPAPKAPLKPAAKTKPPVSSKTATKPSSKAAVVPPKGKKDVAPTKAPKGLPTPVVAKGAKAAKGAKTPKVDHEAQKKMLDKHRGDHDQSGVTDVVPRAKLQFYTIADLKSFLEKRNKAKVKLNVWVPEEERKAREKAAAAARSQGSRSNNVATASIADLLGGANPFRKGAGFVDESKQVPEKFRRYYRLLADMRDALHKGLAFHSEEALKKSGKDDSGDLSGYSQHLADAGTDTADRDFALSLISNEQEGLKEIADAIERMKNGSYGTCEITGKVIPPARLIAVPFTRYSLEGQKELERNRRAHRRRGGNPLGEISDEVGFGTGGGGGEEEPSDS
jgi:RNA polymerase-binding transcription factor DksA